MLDPKTAKKEGAQQRAAFEYFYNQGNPRKCKEVAVQMGVNPNTISNWRKKFKWDEQAKECDLEIVHRVAKTTDLDDAVETRVEHREMIHRCLNILKAKINESIKVDETKQIIEVTITAIDWQRLIESFIGLVKLDLLLTGEVTEREEKVFVMEVVGVDLKKFPEPFDIVATG